MFSIIKADLLILIRDKTNVFFLIVFPVLLVFLLGNLLQDLDKVDTAIEPLNVKYMIETKDPYDKASIQIFLEEIEDNETISIEETDNMGNAIEELNSGDISGIVVFTQPMGVKVYDGLDTVQSRALNTIMNSFAVQASSIKTIYNETPEKMANIEEVLAKRNVEENQVDFSRSMLDYYAVTMLIMMIFLSSAIGGALKIYEGRKEGTLSRTLISPKSRNNLYFQTAMGGLSQTLIQSSVIMICSVLLLGAHYADSIQGNLILFVTFVITGTAICSLFTLIGIFVKSNPTMVIMPILWVLMFISGTFSKEIYVEGVTELSPIWIIQNAAFDLTVFGNYGKCLAVMAVAFALLVMSTIAGTLLFNRKALVS